MSPGRMALEPKISYPHIIMLEKLEERDNRVDVDQTEAQRGQESHSRSHSRGSPGLAAASQQPQLVPAPHLRPGPAPPGAVTPGGASAARPPDVWPAGCSAPHVARTPQSPEPNGSSPTHLCPGEAEKQATMYDSPHQPSQAHSCLRAFTPSVLSGSPHCSLNTCPKAFTLAIPSAWNSLSQDARMAQPSPPSVF